MLLAPEIHRDIAQRAIWYFDIFFGAMTGDSAVFTGDGVDDLDRLIGRLNNNAIYNRSPDQRFMVDVGILYADYRACDIEDIMAIKEQYIAFHGNVDKPDAYLPDKSAAISTDSTDSTDV